MILNVTVFVVRFYRRALEIGTDRDCYCVCWVGAAESIIEVNSH
jgi:hypothetical protein